MQGKSLRELVVKAVEDGNSEYWEKSRAVEEQWRSSQPSAPVDGPGTIIKCIAENVLAALDQQAEEREALERDAALGRNVRALAANGRRLDLVPLSDGTFRAFSYDPPCRQVVSEDADTLDAAVEALAARLAADTEARDD